MKYLVLFVMILGSLTLSAQVEETVTLSPDFDECAAPVIEYFKDEGTGKKWKIVIGRNIEYRAKRPKKDGWKWELGNNTTGVFEKIWNFEATPSSAFKRFGTGRIPIAALVSTELMPTDNSLFGLFIPPTPGSLENENGFVKVTVQDGGGGTNDPFIDHIDSGSDQVKIFFEKDLINNNLYIPPVPPPTTPPPGTLPEMVPNWFYYWSQEVSSLLEAPGIKFFTMVDDIPVLNPISAPATFVLDYKDDGDFAWTVVAGSNITYGDSNSGSNWFEWAEMTTVPNSVGVCPPLDFRRVMTGYGNLTFVIRIGQSCGYENEVNTFDPATGLVSGAGAKEEGIEVFVSTVIHEMEHFNLRVNLWPGGYDSADDCDKDEFPDSWEMGPVGITYGFMVGTDDKYTGSWDQDFPANSLPSMWYQEVICRNKQTGSNVKIYNNKDWSFDPTDSHQGKNWNK